MMGHNGRVQTLVEQIRSSTGRVKRERSGDGCTFREAAAPSADEARVSLSSLKEILWVNPETQQIQIEPGVTMEKLVQDLTSFGFYPPVLTEFRHMTFGGAVIGLGGESSSIHHGFIHESVIEYEFVTGGGDVIIVRPDNEYASLFHAIPGSYGSLGLVTAMRIQCVPRAAYVRCTYEWHPHSASLIKWWRTLDWSSIDFVDGCAVSSKRMCSIYGREVDESMISVMDRARGRVPTFKSDTSMWYYNHVLSKESGEVEYLTFEDYVFRWDRGAFFNASMRMEPTLWNRWLYGRRLSTKALYARAKRRSIVERECRKMNQDMMVPISKLEEFLRSNDESHASYPMWLLPMRSTHAEGLFTFPKVDEMYVDVGTYGYSRKQPFDFVRENRLLEAKVREAGGIKCLWNQGYYTEEEFWKCYDRERYSAVRASLGANGRFDDVWRKTCAFAAEWNRPVVLGEEHRERVRAVQTALERREEGRQVTLERRKVNYTMHHNEYKDGTVRIDVSEFDHILDVNPMTQRVWVEPGVTMERLYEACSKVNMIPCVLPELRHLTVGGLISGAGLETSSFRYGQFNDTCTTIELVLANGEHRQCSATTNQDLYYGVCGSFGSLGILTAVEIQCRAAAPMVTLEYHRFASTKEAVSAMGTFTNDLTVDFVEGIVLDATTSVLIIGTLDAHHSEIQQLDLEPWHAPWFTEHVSDVLRDQANSREQLPLRQYLFRHDRGCFWTGMYARTPSFGMVPKINIGRMRNVRKLLCNYFDTATLWSKLHQKGHTEREKRFVFQDIYVPIEETAGFVKDCDSLLGIYPIWLCPVKATTTPQFYNPHRTDRTELMVDVGLYGVPTTLEAPYDGIALNRQLEALMIKAYGMKMFYGRCYFTRDEWDEAYSDVHSQYSELREKTGASSTFVEIATKLRIES